MVQHLAAAGPQPGPIAGAPDGRSIPVRRLVEACASTMFALFIFFTCFTFLRPSPYDFIAIPTILLWGLLGLRVHRPVLTIMALLLIWLLSTITALLPHLDEPLSVEWSYQFAYLILTGIFFIAFFSDDTHRRVRLGLNAYLASCLFAALCGILSYFDALGGDVFYKMDGRASGVFEDPNLLGSFLILSALYLVHNLLTGRARHVFLSIVALAVLFACIFLSFSRGSWGATVVGLTLMMALTWKASPSRAVRRRLERLSAFTAVTVAVVVAGLMTLEGVADRFTDRAQVTKDYDEGETGRFGNQARGIPMLLDRPLGFGPLRWRQTFTLDPHNSYIGSFANGGWLAGFAFIGIALTTVFVGFRLCLSPSPYQRYGQIAFPALLMFFFQAFQIDIEKWRHVYMMLGMVWGLEAARWAWLREAAAARARPRAPAKVSGALTADR